MQVTSASHPLAITLPLYVLLGSSLYLYCNLFSPGGTPFLLGGDEQVFWMNALRMRQGELIYRDFFEFTPPGTDLVYLAAFTLLGPRVWVPNAVQLLLAMSLVCVCWRISRCIMRPAEASLAAALFLVLDYGRWMDGTHHWFSVLSVMMAVAVLMRGISAGRVVTCGSLLGLASFFTQTRGLVAATGFAAFLLWDGLQTRATLRTHVQRSAQLLLSLILTWAFLSSPFIFKVGITRLFYFQATYVLEYVANEARNLWPLEHHPLSWPVRDQVFFFAGPLIYATALWRAWKPAVVSSVETRTVALLAFAGAAMYLEVAASPNVLRVSCVLLPAFILFVWLLASAVEQLPDTARWRGYAVGLTWTVLAGLGVHQVWSRNSTHSLIVDLPAGRAAVEPLAGEKLTWLARHTTPGERFFQASYQSLYLPLGLRNPTFDYLDRYTSAEFVALDLLQLAASPVRYILWSPLDRPRYPQFEQFLLRRYHRVAQFRDGDEVWELNGSAPLSSLGADSAVCPAPHRGNDHRKIA